MGGLSHPNRFLHRLARRRAAGRPLILDGPTGTELDNRGGGLTAPLWSGAAPLEMRELLFQVHREYAEAGADVLTTCTFRTTRRVFERAGRPAGEWSRAARAAVETAREAAGDSSIVAGSVAPLEDCFVPSAAPSGAAAESEHFELCSLLAEAGVDVLWLETFGTLGELRAAMRAAIAASKRRIPFAVSVTTDRQGNLISGEPSAHALEAAANFGAAAFCINCIPPGHVRAVLPLVHGIHGLPVGVYANLGIPENTQDWRGSAHLTPSEYAAEAARWGADIVGACCGATPAHIRALHECFRNVS